MLSEPIEECQNHACEPILSYTVLKVEIKKQNYEIKCSFQDYICLLPGIL